MEPEPYNFDNLVCVANDETGEQIRIDEQDRDKPDGFFNSPCGLLF